MALVDIQDIGLVEFPDDITEEQILGVAKRLHQGRLASFGSTIAKEPGRMAGQSLSGVARLGQMIGETLERQPMAFGPGGMVPATALQSDEEIRKTAAIPKKSGAQLASELESNPLYQTGRNITQGTEDAFPTNPLHADKFETAVGSGIGSVLGLLPATLAGPAAPLVAGGIYGTSAGEAKAREAGDVIDARIVQAKQTGDTATAATLERDKFHMQEAAFLANAVVGAASEGALGVASRLVPIGAGNTAVGKWIAEKGIAHPMARGAVEGGVRESVQESIEQGGQNVAARVIYDPEQKLTEGMGISAGAGGVVGALFGGAAGGLHRRQALASSPAQRAVAPGASSEVDDMVDALARAPIVPESTDEDVLTAPLAAPVAQPAVPATPAPVPATPAPVPQPGTPDPVIPAGTAENPPTPETPETISAQFEAMMDPASSKSVTLLTPGTESPDIPKGAEIVQTRHGVAVFDPSKIDPEEVYQAASGPIFDPGPLGMGAAVPASDTAVQTKDAEGTTVIAELATPETVPAAEAAQQAAVPGGTTSVVPAAQVIAEREAENAGQTTPISPASTGAVQTVTEEPKAPAAVPGSGQENAAAGQPATTTPNEKGRETKLYDEGAVAENGEIQKQDSQKTGSKTPQNTASLQTATTVAATDRIDAALTKAIEATRLEPGAYSFGRAIPQAAFHAILRGARMLYRAGRSIAEAIQEAIRQHRIDNPSDQFDDADMEQAVTEAIQTGIIQPAAAPGLQTQMSQGVFTGPITKDTDKQWNATASEWVDQFGQDLQAAIERATSPNTTMDGALRQYVLTEIVSRTNEQAERANNVVDTLTALRIQERAAKALSQSGAVEFGKVGAARFLAFKRIEHLMPVLAYRNLVRSAQSRLPFPELTSENVRKWLRNAGRRAVNETRDSMRKADNIVARELRREVRDMGETWRKIITSSLDVQGDFRRALYAAVLAHPDLEGISPAATTEIVNLLADEWERQRMRIFRSEFRKEVPLPRVSERNVSRLEEALPAIVIQSNIGLLDNDAFRNAIAPKFGVAQFDAGTARVVNKLAQEAQALPDGVLRNRKLAQIMDAIRRSNTVRFRDVFRDYWYAAMLSGIRTQVDNALSIFNGTLNVGMAMARNPTSIPLQTAAYWEGLTEAAQDFMPIMRGERWRMHNVDVDRPASALEAMLKSQNIFARVIGHGAFVSRLIGAFDHLNALSTRNAMLAWGMFRLDPEQARQSLSVSAEDRSAAREQAIMEGAPKNLINKRAREILEQRFPIEQIMSATDIGRQVSFQNEPYGMAGHLYRFIQKLDEMPGIGNFARIVSGTAFARYALNYTNDILNYVAPISLYRWYRSAPENLGPGETANPEARELMLMKAALGTLVGAVASAVFLGDDDDEKKRAIDITGSFRSLTKDHKNQLLSEGRQPYSFRFGNTYVSYRQLPIAGILSSVGELRDRQIFDKEKFNQESVAVKLGNAMMAGMMIVRDSSAIVGLMDVLGFAQTYKYDVEAMADKTVPKFVARLLGSLIPNIAKEVDAWTDPGLYRPNSGWEFFMAQTPWVRRDLPPGPAVDIFGDKIAVERLPWSRWIRTRKEDPDWEKLGALASKGIFLPMTGKWKIENDDGSRRDPTPAEMLDYQKKVGAGYREYIRDNGAKLLEMDPEEAKDRIDKETSRIRKSIRREL